MNPIAYFFNHIKGEKELVKNTIFLFCATSVSALITFFINLVFSRIFGPENFGIFKNILYLFTLIPVLISLGAAVTLTKYIAEFRASNKEKIGHMVRWFLKVRIFSFALVILLLLIIRDEIAIHFLHNESLSFYLIPAIFLVFTSFFNIFPSMVLGYENFKLYSLSKIASSILFGIGLPLGYFFGVYYAIWAFVASMLIGDLICFKFLLNKKSFEPGIKFKMENIFLKYSVPMYIFSIPGFLVGGIIPFLTLFFSTKLIGYFAFSMMFYFATQLIPGSFSNVLLPKISKLNGMKKFKDAKNSLKKVFVFYSIVCVFGIIGCLLFSKIIISIIAPEYLPSLLIFKSLVCYGFIVGFATIYVSYLSAREKVKQIAVITLVQNVLLFAIGFLVLSSF